MDINSISKYVGKKHTDEVKTLLEQNQDLADSISFKNPAVSLALAIFLGMFGIDRLYQGGIKSFLCKLGIMLLTLGTWYIVDIGYTMMITKENNYEKIIAAA